MYGCNLSDYPTTQNQLAKQGASMYAMTDEGLLAMTDEGLLAMTDGVLLAMTGKCSSILAINPAALVQIR